MPETWRRREHGPEWSGQHLDDLQHRATTQSQEIV